MLGSHPWCQTLRVGNEYMSYVGCVLSMNSVSYDPISMIMMLSGCVGRFGCEKLEGLKILIFTCYYQLHLVVREDFKVWNRTIRGGNSV